MKLSDFHSAAEIVRDGEFTTLGGSRTLVNGTLAYADTLHHARILAENERISCLITRPDLAEKKNWPSHIGLCAVENPREAFYTLHERFIDEGLYPKFEKGGIASGCRIHPTAQIAEGVCLEEGVTIGEYAVVRPGTVIRKGAFIEAGVVLGAEGILYHKGAKGIRRIRHAGGVEIGAGASVLANAVVARSVHPSIVTYVGERSIIGIATTIGHEAYIGNDCVISGNCVVARNAVLEDGCYLGTTAVVRENLTVGRGARLLAGAIAVASVPAGMEMSGNFARPHADRLREFARQQRS